MPESATLSQPTGRSFDLPRATLITPSASPPSSCPASPAARRKSTSRPPPLKRVRTDSTRGSLTPSTASTSSEPAEPVDSNRDEAWRQSSQRLLDKWAQLAERYNVPLDQDDIIDFRTNKLVKDRGVTRRAKKILQFGELLGEAEVDASSEDGAVDENDDENERENENGAEPREREAPVKVKLEMEKTNRVLSPFTEMNPADADDLKAFLAEEERRRRTGGVDDWEDDDEGSDWVTDYGPEGGARSGKIRVMVGTFDRPPSPEDDSEDEFVKWDPDADDATPRPPPPRSVSRPSSTDIIDLTTPSPPSSPEPPAARPRTPAKAPVRSHSPPLLEQIAPEPGPSSRKPAIPPRARSGNLQLQTPPLSSQSSSEIGTPTTSHDERILLVPRLSARSSSIVAPQTNGQPSSSSSTRKPGRPRLSSSLSHIDILEEVRDPSPPQPKPQRRKSATPGSRPRVVPEVVITGRPKLDKRKAAKRTSPERSPFIVERETPLLASPILRAGSPPRTPSKRKGKEVAKAVESALDSSDDEPLPPPKPRAKSRPPEPLAMPGPSSPPPHRGCKRKRSMSPPISSPIRKESTPSPSRKSASRARSLPPASVKPTRSTTKGKAREQIASEDEPDSSPNHARNTRSRARSRVNMSKEQPHPYHASAAPSFPPPTTPKRRHDALHLVPSFPPPLPMQDPQAQYHIAQAVHYLSYLFANGGAPGYVPPIPMPYSQAQPTPVPQTPRRRSRASRRDSCSSPDAESSSLPPSSPYTPMHKEQYQFHFDPTYSSATPPPASSSPIPSPPSSPAPRTPGGHGHSKSRSRRVSSKLDPEDRPPQKGQRTQSTTRDGQMRYADDQRGRGHSGKERRAARDEDCCSDDDDPPMPKSRGERGRTPGASTRSASVPRRR